jgi:hypothetical protein
MEKALEINMPDRHGNLCPQCKKEGKYSPSKNAYFCPDCNIWINFLCDDPICDECKGKRWYALNKPLYEKMLDIEINKRSGR